jgi:calcineurin-like phosphoesterase family protein
MFKNLYDNFAHWFHDGQGTVYFYSDPHFNDPEMVQLRKNYIGDAKQVKSINSKIGKYDTLVVLGDVGDIERVRQIRGYKVLVMGNHDAGATNYKRQVVTETFHVFNASKEEAIQIMKEKYPNWKITSEVLELGRFTKVTADNCLFDEVYEGALMIAPNIILSHEPVNFPFAVNIHGHDHSNWYQGGINMCAEHIDYTPVPLKDLVEKGMLKAPDIHRETIDKAIDRKAKRK